MSALILMQKQIAVNLHISIILYLFTWMLFASIPTFSPNVTLTYASEISHELVSLSSFLRLHNHSLAKVISGEVFKDNVMNQCTVKMPRVHNVNVFAALVMNKLINVTRFSFVFKNVSTKCL